MCASRSGGVSRCEGDCAIVRYTTYQQPTAVFLGGAGSVQPAVNLALQVAPQIPAGSPSLRDGASYSPSDVATLKLLRHLQERVKQLRVDFSGSRLTTVRLLLFIIVVFPNGTVHVF